MPHPQRKGGKKNRKHGRNKVKCAHYRAAKAEKNKIAKLARHLKRFPGDKATEVRLLAIRRHGTDI